MQINKRLTTLAIAALVTFAGEAHALDAVEAHDLVANAAHDAVDAFAGRKLTTTEAESTLQGLLDKYSDMRFQSQQVLGRFWKTTSADQQREFSTLLNRFIVVAYGSMIDEVPATLEIEVATAEPQGNRFVVHSRAGTSRQEMMPVDWVVAETPDGRPVIADISVEGCGLFRTRQEEFGSIIRSAGGQLDGLVGILRGKINVLAGTGQALAAR